MFLPICIDTTHWILGDVDLTSMKMVVYDTYMVEALTSRVKITLTLFTMRSSETFDSMRAKNLVELMHLMYHNDALLWEIVVYGYVSSYPTWLRSEPNAYD